MAASSNLIPASVLFREILARGYEGGETRVNQFVGWRRYRMSDVSWSSAGPMPALAARPG
jgi:hypothetical protein